MLGIYVMHLFLNKHTYDMEECFLRYIFTIYALMQFT